MIHLGFDKPNEAYDPEKYIAIAKSVTDTRATECTREEYEFKLNCLPPISVPGGFLVMEACCDHPSGRMVHSMYAKIGDRYYAKHVLKGVPATYIRDVTDAYPIDPEQAEIARGNYDYAG